MKWELAQVVHNTAKRSSHRLPDPSNPIPHRGCTIQEVLTANELTAKARRREASKKCGSRMRILLLPLSSFASSRLRGFALPGWLTLFSQFRFWHPHRHRLSWSDSMSSQIRQFARQVLEVESAAVGGVIPHLDDDFDKAVRLILDCRGAVLTSGIGKAGHVARKLSASFSSTGTPSHFLSPADALHGDLGSVRRGDVVVILSHSGESDEIVRILSVLKKLGNPVIAITATADNSLARFSDAVLKLGKIEEACPLGLAPSASTTAMAALGDALFLSVMKERNFTAEDFA